MEEDPRWLPVDVLADVLGRLAPRSLAVSRCVCRGWRDAVDERCQLRAVTDLLPTTLAGIFIETNDSCGTPSFFVRPSMAHRVDGDFEDYMGSGLTSVADCCNGLVLRDDDGVSVVNPATRRWIRLPRDDSDGFYYKYLVFDPTVSPHYDVLAMKDPKDMPEWLPPVYMMRVYSSTTGRWEERPFAREGPVTVAASSVWSWQHGGFPHAAYRNGALYAFWSNFIFRITLSDNKYQVINSPPAYKYESQYYRCHLGKSKNGVHLAVVDDVEHRLQVWFLDESGGRRSGYSSVPPTIRSSVRQLTGHGSYKALAQCRRRL